MSAPTETGATQAPSRREEAIRRDALLTAFRSARVLDALDVRFARAAGRLLGEDRPEVRLALALACRAPGHGHVCVDLADVATSLRVEPGADGLLPALPWPEPAPWVRAVADSPAVRGPDADADGQAPPPEHAPPAVLDGTRLYLDRYWALESRLVTALTARAAAPVEQAPESRWAEDVLARLGLPDDADHAGPRAAVTQALRGRLLVLAGGPGTGKTTTVAKLVAALALDRERRGLAPPRVRLVAPTGKASARVAEALAAAAHAQLSGLGDAVDAAWPSDGATVHRALGYLPNTPTRFRHGPSRPLRADVVVLDEASMVDLGLMTRLVEAVPMHARLLLVGDPDQLASVEAGAVFGDMGRAAETLGRGAALGRARVVLDKTWRFGADSGIGALARACNAGDGPRARALLGGTFAEPPSAPPYGDLTWLGADAAEGELAAALEQGGAFEALVRDGYGALIRAAVAGDAPAAVEALGGFRLLAAHRRGALGVEGLGGWCERWLEADGFRPPRDPTAPLAVGRPIGITRNAPALGLSNGDVGVLVRRRGAADPDSAPPLACFPDATAEDGVRVLAPSRLPPFETVWATTVHKSQGSQYAHVALVLPDGASRVATRELVYTGVTRAESRVTIAATAAAIDRALDERVSRASGLAARLARRVVKESAGE